MRLKTFFAKDMKEALAAMRVELGEEAIIVASETMKDGSVLLRAGVESGEAQPKTEEEAPQMGAAAETAPDEFALASFESRYHENLLRRLRAPKLQDGAPSIPFDKAMLLSCLRAHRLGDGLAQALAEDAEKSELPDLTLALAASLDTRMRAAPLLTGRGGAFLMIGPPGAGKTSVSAKLAAQNCAAGHEPRLFATDLATAGQVARLETLARCLDLTVTPGSTPEFLADAVREAKEAEAILLADSAGFDPRGSLPSELPPFLALEDIAIVGVVSASCDAEEAAEIAPALGRLGATKLVVTGLDLARRKGALAAYACSGLSIVQVTGSPYLADGLQTLTPFGLARALLDTASFGGARRAA